MRSECIAHPDIPIPIGVGFGKGDPAFGKFVTEVTEMMKPEMQKTIEKYSTLEFLRTSWAREPPAGQAVGPPGRLPGSDQPMSSSSYVWDFSVFFKHLPFLLQGLQVTVVVSLLAMVVGAVVGLVVALARLSPIPPLRWLAAFYVDFLRSTPLLIQLVWVFFALPILLGFSLSPIVAGVVTLGAYSGAYLAEIFRAGILSIASASGMRPWRSA